MDITKLEKEISKHNESFCSEARGMTLTQVKDSLARESLGLQSIIDAMKDDDTIGDLKAQLKELTAPYRETAKKTKQKIEFLVAMIEEKQITE